MNDTSIGDAIYRIRKERNMSQEDLASACKVGRTTIHRIENGSAPTLTVLSKIAMALKVDTWMLMKYAHALAPKTVQGVVNL